MQHTFFNQSGDCFAAALPDGFRIFNCSPLSERCRRTFSDGGIAIVEMLHRTNYLALVGGGRNPKWAPNKVLIWDDLKGKAVIEMEFKTQIRSVKLRRDRIVVCLTNKVFCYTLNSQPEKLFSWETCDNDLGVIALCSSPNCSFLAIPGRQPGHIQLVDIGIGTVTSPIAINRPTSANTNSSSAVHRLSTSPFVLDVSDNIPTSSPVTNTSPPSPTHSVGSGISLRNEKMVHTSIIPAHNSQLAFLCFNPDGNLLASASTQGTLIRIYECATGKLMHEFRRGADPAMITSIAFNTDSTMLCVASDKSTVHLFKLTTDFDKESSESDYQRESSAGSDIFSKITETVLPHPGGNRQSSFSLFKTVLPKYFSSSWSFASIHLDINTPIQCCFDIEGDAIHVLSGDMYFRYVYDRKVGGECKRDICYKYLALNDE